jgi:hypothetical protein
MTKEIRMDKLRSRLRVETVLAATSFVLGILTAIAPDWIEAMTGRDPDYGSGALEWTITGALFIVAAIAGALAGLDYRRLTTQRSG